MFSIPHMVVLFVIVLVVFGPQKLPELARSLGKLMAEFRKASTDFKGAFEEEMRAIERQGIQAEREKAAAEAAAAATGTSPETAAALAESTSPEPHPAALIPEYAASDETAPGGPVVTPVAEAIAHSSEPEPAAESIANTNGELNSKPNRILPDTAQDEARDQEQHV